jgi:hypothetical protein
MTNSRDAENAGFLMHRARHVSDVTTGMNNRHSENADFLMPRPGRKFAAPRERLKFLCCDRDE